MQDSTSVYIYVPVVSTGACFVYIRISGRQLSKLELDMTACKAQKSNDGVLRLS